MKYAALFLVVRRLSVTAEGLTDQALGMYPSVPALLAILPNKCAPSRGALLTRSAAPAGRSARPPPLCSLSSPTALPTLRRSSVRDGRGCDADHVQTRPSAASLASSALTPRRYAPAYILPHSIVLGFSCLTWLTFLANTLYCVYENKAREAGKRDGNIAKYEALVRSGKTSAPIGDRAPSFRFVGTFEAQI